MLHKIAITLFAFLVISGTAYCDTISFDQLASSGDLTATKYNSDLDRAYAKLNYGLMGQNIVSETLTEPLMDDNVNPRVRTYELLCEAVQGMDVATGGGSLTENIALGVSYPRGYRCEKTAATSNTWTANKWTFYYIDQNCDFQYEEVNVGAADPTTPANSVIIGRVSTDSTEVVTWQDRRQTTCIETKFDEIAQSTTEPSLHNLFINGIPRLGVHSGRGGEVGWLQGLQIEYDSHTQFKVKSGGAWINAEYRITSTDETVTTANDDPTNGGNGLDSGAIANSTIYHVYAVADESSVPTLSISYSTNATTPAGVTNSRYLGRITTDASSLFTSTSIVNAYDPGEFELVAGWVDFNGSGATFATDDMYNVSAIAQGAAGNGYYDVTWDIDFNRDAYIAYIQSENTANPIDPAIGACSGKSTGSASFVTQSSGGVKGDCSSCMILAIGDRA